MMEGITKDYRVDCSESENILIREFLTKQGWTVRAKYNIGDMSLKKPWQLWLEACTHEIWQADDNDFFGEQICAKEFIKRFGPKEDSNEPQVGDLVEWKWSDKTGTGYLVENNGNSDSIVEVVTGISGWDRDDEIPENYKSKATNKYWWVGSFKKIKEEVKKESGGVKVGDQFKHKISGDIIEITKVNSENINSKTIKGGMDCYSWTLNYLLDHFDKIEEKEAVKEDKSQSTTKFKRGDRVRNKESGEENVVLLVPGMSKYDSKGFAVAEEGMVLKNGTWVYQDEWEKIKKEVQLTDDSAPIMFNSGDIMWYDDGGYGSVTDTTFGDAPKITSESLAKAIEEFEKDKFEDLSAPDLFERGLEKFDSVINNN